MEKYMTENLPESQQNAQHPAPNAGYAVQSAEPATPEAAIVHPEGFYAAPAPYPVQPARDIPRVYQKF